MGRATGSIVTLALLVLLVVASTSPARATVPGGAGNGQHQQGGDQGGAEDRTQPRDQSGPAAGDRDRDEKDRGGGNGQDDRDTPIRAQAQPDEKDRDQKERNEPPRDEKDRDEKPRDEKDRDDKPRDQKDRDDKPRDEKDRDDKPRDEKDGDPRERDEADDRDEEAERDRRTGRGEADGPRRDRTPPAQSRGTPRRPLEGETSDDTAAADRAPSTPANSDSGTPVISDATPPLDPESLQTMGLGGYVAGDFGWFDGRSGGGQLFGVPDVPAMIGGLPVLLALLGAFLALQRGIGQGLGHVPMDPTSTEQGPHGQH